LLLTAGTVALLLLARSELRRAHLDLAAPGGIAFAPALVALATVMLVLSVVWLWCVMTAATLEALHGAHPVDHHGELVAVPPLEHAGCVV
jgi:hypothetical protein